MADTEEKSWWGNILEWIGKAWESFAATIKEFFDNALSGLSGFWSKHIDNSSQQDQAGAQRVINESAKKGQEDGRKLADELVNRQLEGTVDLKKLQEQATQEYKTNLVKGALQRIIERRQSGELDEVGYNKAIEGISEASQKNGMSSVVFAQMLSDELKAHNVNPSEWGSAKITTGTLATVEAERGERRDTAGVSVVIQGDRAGADARFIQENQKEICDAFIAIYEQKKIPQNSPLTFENGKWIYKKGEQKVEIDPAAVTIAASRSEGLGGPLSFDGDPRAKITRVNGPKVKESGELEFIESKQYEIKDLGKENIAGKKTSGTQPPMYSAAILNDEIAAYVASNSFEKATVSVQDNDRKDAGIAPLSVTIEDVTPPPPATPAQGRATGAAVGS